MSIRTYWAKQGKFLRHTDEEFVLVKPMADGPKVVGLFNIGSAPCSISLALQNIDAASQ
jgi:hypothetical protein